MNDDQRPPVWVGHVDLRSANLDDTEGFFKQVGLRPVFRGDDVAVLEFRGGTHIVVIRDPESEPCEASFDLMVENLDSFRKGLLAQGFEPTEISSLMSTVPSRNSPVLL